MIFHCQVVVVADEEELSQYIPYTNLTPELGGYLLYGPQSFHTFSRVGEDYVFKF